MTNPWLTIDYHTARCARCGGVSVWKPGVYVWIGRDVLLTYWRWWKGFKRRHGKCLERRG